jgi:V8-like Glu-specific endopeptidase
MADQFLSIPDRQELANVVAGVYDFQLGPAARLQFLDKAGLKRFAPTIDLAAPPSVLAGVLIGRLEPFGMLPEQPTYHALGSLVSLVLSQPDTPNSDKQFLAGLIVKYGLVADRDYLGQLRSQYNLDVVPVREVDTAAAPPPHNTDIPAAPGFTADVGDEAGLELIVNSEDNFLDIYAMAGAMYCAQAVGRVELPQGTALGTGFLVAPDMLLTNQHVLKTKSYLAQAVVRFDYQLDAEGVASPGRVVAFDPDFYVSSPDTELDFALVKLKEEPLGALRPQPGEERDGKRIEDLPFTEQMRLGRHRGYLLLAPAMIVERERVNIIQHPNGNPQKAVLTQNYVIHDMSETRVQYLADTMPGSSGSPVFNRRWDVVALHHSGGPHPPQKLSDTLQSALKGHFRFNEGIPMRAIMPQIERYLPRV